MRSALPAVLLLAAAFVPCVASAAVEAVPVQPFYFERLDDSAYLARVGGASLLLEKGGATVSRGAAVVRLGFAAASVPRGAGLLPSRSHRLIGRDPALWMTDIPHFSAVRYSEAFPGIDLLFHAGSSAPLEFDVVIAPHADPGRVLFNAPGAALALSPAGDLTIDGITLHRPRAFQGELQVPASFALRGDGAFGFDLGEYDPNRALTIDPEIEYSTYVGGVSSEIVTDLFVDGSGNMYLTGSTYSADYPTAGAYQSVHRGHGERDAFVTKFNAAGALVFSTLFGGEARDIAEAVTVDAEGNVYIAGDTYSLDLPTTPNAFQTSGSIWVGEDGFVVKLAPSGNALRYMTYLRSTISKPSIEYCRDLAVDAAGNLVIVGEVDESMFPTTPGVFQPEACAEQDAFVFKMNASGTAPVFSTYLCGNGNDWGQGVALDAQGNIYVTGLTTSGRTFPTAAPTASFPAGPNDAYVARLSPDGKQLFKAILIGGSGSDYPSGIAVFGSRVAVVGKTNSTDFPLLRAHQAAYGGTGLCTDLVCGDAWVAEFGLDLTRTMSTYLGGFAHDDAAGVAFLADGRLVVGGTTFSSNFPRKQPLQSGLLGSRDAWVAIFRGATLEFSTPIGGSGNDHGTAIGAQGENVFIAGDSYSSNYPLVSPWQSQKILGDNTDVFLTRIHAAAPVAPKRPRAVRK